MPPLNHPKRVRLWDWAQALLLSANLGWTTLCLGGFMAKTMVVTSSLTAALLVLHAFCLLLDRRRSHPAGFWFVPFLVYAAANVAWVTPVRWLGWIDWFDWAQLIAVFWIVLSGIRSRRAQAALFGAVLALAIVAVWLACYQRFVQPSWLMLGRTQADQFVGRSSGPFGIPNSLAALLLLLIPAVGALTFRRQASVLARIFFGWVLVVLLFGVGLTVSRGAWLGLAVALTVWPLVGLRAGWGKRLLLAAAIAVGIAATGAAVYTTSPLVRERFSQLARDLGERSRPILWRAAWQMFRNHPVAGAGAGSFNVRFEKYRPEGFLPQPMWAHNDYVNTLSDYGAVGFALFFGAAGVVIVCALRARRRSMAETSSPGPAGRRRDWLDDPRVQQGLGVGLLAFALQLFVDFHFKIPALAMAFACVAALLVSRVWPGEASSSGDRARWISFAAALGLAGFVTVRITPLYRGEALRFDAREAMDRMALVPLDDAAARAKLGDVRRELDRAVAIAPTNAQAWADRSYATAQWYRLDATASAERFGKEAEADADRAIALSAIVAEFWVRRGVALDIQGRWTDAGVVFAQAIVLSPNAVLPSYHYAYHMSLRPTGLEMAEAAVEFCLRLDPTNPEALRLRQRLATSRSGL